MKAMFAILFLIAGCSTAAEREVSRVQGIAVSDAPTLDACWAKVLKSPQHQALRDKTGDYADSPTFATKTNPDKVTASDAAQLLSLHQEYLAPCRKMAVESAGRVGPTIVAILADSYADADANLARLVGRQITWGTFVTDNQGLITERRARLLRAAEQLQKDLVDSNPVDTGLQQRAIDALSSWTHRQRALLMSGPWVNATSQLRITSCRYIGAALSCTFLAAESAHQGWN
jgi:hypothetical protein